MSNIKTIEVNRNQIKHQVGVIASIATLEENQYYKNTVISYMGDMKVLIKTNLTQKQWNKFCEGKLSKKRLKQLI